MTYIFGKKIKELRKAQCLTLDEVAQKTNTAKGYISDIENTNRRPPSDKIIRKLSRALKVDKKILLRLAHIDKIPEDIKQELQASKIITPKDIIEEMGSDLKSILKETGKRKKKPDNEISNDYVPVINTEKEYPYGFSGIDELINSAKDFIRFSISGITPQFAVYLPDNLMERKAAPSFKEKSLVFFDEDNRVKKESFVFVVYQTELGMTSTFRQLKAYERSKIRLSALHPKCRKELVLPRRAIKKMWKMVAYLESYT